MAAESTTPGARAGRRESPLERLDRQWGELLQELRVVQTGVQLLTGFLLTLPFQQRFEQLTDGQRRIYLAVVSLAVGSTVLLVAPVALHRILFRHHGRGIMVNAATYFALFGSMLLGLAIAGVMMLIFDLVVGSGAGILAGTLTFVALAILWVAGPLWARMRLLRRAERE